MQLSAPPPSLGRRRATATAVAAVGTLILTLGATPASAGETTPAGAPAAGQAEHAAATPASYVVTGAEDFDDVDAIAATGAAVDDIDRARVTVTAVPTEVAAIRALGFTVEPAPTPPDVHGDPAAYPPGYQGYHTFDELVDVVDQLESDHPDLVRRVDFGTSYQGRDLFAVQISDNVGVDQGQPEVLFNSGQHAREHLTVEMAIDIMEMFTDGYGSDPRITELVDSRVIWVVPNFNPDGAEYDIAGSSFRSWRKNRQPNPGTSAVGTDLNRNWGHQWGGPGSSGNPASATYRGAAPFSAPEAAALRDFVLSRVIDGEQRITVHIDFHTYSELVLWPYGYTSSGTAPGLDADARDTFVAIGQEMAASNGYTPMQASDLYVTSGGQLDWMWADQGIFSYVFEMYPSSAAGGGFYPSDSVIAAETARNREAVLLLTEYADCPWRAIGKQEQYCGDGGDAQLVWSDNFDTSTGWVRDPFGTDTATEGLWARANPEPTSWQGIPLQLDNPISGSNVLVTGPLAGSGPGDHDIDDGVTTARSPAIELPAPGEIELSLYWYLAHLNNSDSDDYFRVSVQHSGGTDVLLEQRGAPSSRPAEWTPAALDLTPYAGQTVRIVIEAADEGSPSLVEAAVDDVRVTVSGGAALSPAG